MTIQEFKNKNIALLSASENPAVRATPSLDISIIIEDILSFSKTRQLLNKDYEIPAEKLLKLQEAVEKRLTGLPVAYITGHKEFYGYDFYVSPTVLIPKPDTELLVEKAVEVFLQKIKNHPGKIFTVCDMCTGSGCIGISFLMTLYENQMIDSSLLPKITLVDISQDALDVAYKNVTKLVPENLRDRVQLVKSNLFDVVNGEFDMILTNPPYIPAKMVDELLTDGRSEPRLALDGDVTETGNRSSSDDGLSIIKRLVHQSTEKLAPYGIMLMETGEYNADDAASYSKKYGYRTEVLCDLSGQKRLVIVESCTSMQVF